jgi:hypothetical protein
MMLQRKNITRSFDSKSCFVIVFFIASLLASVARGEAIYRCGNVYTNQPSASGCEELKLSNVTVIEGTKVYTPNSGASASTNYKTDKTVDTAQINDSVQKQRDTQAKEILQSELQKAQTQSSDLQKQLQEVSSQINQAHQDDQIRSKQQQLQQALERSQADVSALERELSRMSQKGVRR